MDHTVLYSATDIDQEVRELAKAIDGQHMESCLVVTVLKGAVIFSSDLVRVMKTETELAYITASSYTDGFIPGDCLRLESSVALGAKDRHVLIVEDIVDTGRTLETIQSVLQQEQPTSITTVALVDKVGRRTSAFSPTYTGFRISHEFIYGYGLDWNQRFRDLPYIAIANAGDTRGD